MSTSETPQQRFNRIYITSSEICRRMKVTRPSLQLARRRGYLPQPIDINHGALYIWERVTVQPYLDAWELVLRARRSSRVPAHA